MWSTGGGAPGEGPSPEQREAFERRMSPPDNEVPVGLPAGLVLGRADGVAVALTRILVHTGGVHLEVSVRLRAALREPHGLHGLLGHGFDARSEDRLLLGVQFADGRRASTLDDDPWRPFDDPGDGPRLVATAGQSDGRTAEQGYWLWPVPPAGPLTLVCAWPAMGVPETVTTLDGGAVAEAARRVEVLWPWEPARAEPHVPPAPPSVPEGSWFSRRRRPGGAD